MNGILSKNSNWKGQEAKYQAFHKYARLHFDTPKLCEHCGSTDDRMYHWAAKDHLKGGRLREDWIRLCVPCHAIYDKRTGKPISEEHKAKIGAKTALTSRGNSNAKGHKLSAEKRKEISEKTKLGMLKWKMTRSDGVTK